MKIANQVGITKPMRLSSIFRTTLSPIALLIILLCTSKVSASQAKAGGLLIQQELPQQQLKDEIRDRVQEEVDIAFGRTGLLLNGLVIALTLFPTAAGVIVWFLLGKLSKQTTIARQEIESLHYDTISQLKLLISDAESILGEIQYQNHPADVETDLLLPDAQIQEFAPVNYGNYQQLLTAADYAKQGDACFFENRYEDAIAAYNQALQIQPDLADTWNNRGVVLTRMQRYPEAIASYEQATTIRPTYPDAWNNRGVVLLELQKYPEAIGCYEQAIQAKPDYADAWNNRGVAFSKMQEYEQAVISYNQALQVKKDYTDAWNNRGVALSKLQKYEAAIESYDNAAKIRPDFYRIWYNKARCYALQGKIDLAIENLKRALNLNPNLCKELAKTEVDLEKLREHDAFKQLIG
ncbi:MAG: tetratricopeptide repeat protein [Microcoleus sp. PH2017_15_JOR_U_A]|uniref:tetratricopeptide repeat protein n=1 Tax=unclassified Microcoleus TaxID=2642155 RepID=UPI001DCA577B|nr:MULTISPECIES: tetratricopeptide repeat protein [unclassified Microcoleus]TAE67927.1 MAG: tetratricopeptide repeat protein [Oscillatoriales cyanobacterium]MCC3475910.1 tetratricopeptide repeat protein [Microcoleus sp. PH2017_13_LAR_U_A]MCC3484088.1 tetratricopeptide repeat protein [Microcoleus sp. PH2017_14_LAR_D_A]MCC3500686.1 tetratricopeptide repeat protein [Microcoleus sp. PH2017_15_JOR_U_A]MCC3596933.1 tetratricopeptide repeat protein [Microcoleus sp. PH2017_26_ELK_O_A]